MKIHWKKLIREWEAAFPEWMVYAFDPDFVVACHVGDRWIYLSPDLVELILRRLHENSTNIPDGDQDNLQS